MSEFALNSSKKLSLWWMHVFTVLFDFYVLHGHVSTFIHRWNKSVDVIRWRKDHFKVLAEFSRGGEAKGLLENWGDQGKKKEAQRLSSTLALVWPAMRLVTVLQSTLCLVQRSRLTGCILVLVQQFFKTLLETRVPGGKNESIGRAKFFSAERMFRCSDFGFSIYCIIPFLSWRLSSQTFCYHIVASRLSDLNLVSNWHTLSLQQQKMLNCWGNCSVVGVWFVGQCNKIYSQNYTCWQPL